MSCAVPQCHSAYYWYYFGFSKMPKCIRTVDPAIFDRVEIESVIDTTDYVKTYRHSTKPNEKKYYACIGRYFLS